MPARQPADSSNALGVMVSIMQPSCVDAVVRTAFFDHPAPLAFANRRTPRRAVEHRDLLRAENAQIA
jgi:hypothetical protein